MPTVYVNDVPVEIGQALQVMGTGVNVAEIIALDPMLAVVEVALTTIVDDRCSIVT